MDVASTLQGLTKIDYVNGLGMSIGTREVSFAHISKRFLRVTLLHARSFSLPEAGVERATALEHACASFLQELQAKPEQVVLCLPRRLAFVSRLVIPETARDSLEQVVEYEIERLVPLPKDELYYDAVEHETGGEERRLGIVILAMPRRVVDEYLTALEAVQLRPQTVTVSGAAFMSAAAYCVPLADGPYVLVGQEHGAIELNFIEKRRLVASHTFSQAQARNEEVLTDLIIQGIARNLPGHAVEDAPVFICPTTEVPPLPASPEHDLLAVSLARFTGAGGDLLPPDGLAAFGAALQAVGEDAVGVNLLPPEKRARREKTLSPLTVGLAGLICLLGLIWPISVIVQQHRMLNAVAERTAALGPSVQRVQAQESEAARLIERLKVVEDSTQKRVVPLLKNLSEVIPSDVYVTNFRYKEGDVEVSGVAAASRAASELVELLESSPCLRNVAPKAPFTKTAQGETFTLGGQVEPCA